MLETKTEIKQEVTLAILGVKLENICEKLKNNEVDLAILKDTLKWQEDKRCRKNDLILATFNQSSGKLEEKMDEMKEIMFTKEQYDRFLESNNGKLRMIDERITKSEKKIDKVWQYLTIAGAILLAIWQFGQSIILEIFKKKI